MTEPTSHSQVRKHYYLDQLVVIAPSRTHALHHKDYIKSGALKHPPMEDAPSIYELKKPNGEWQVKVIKNIYPSFSPNDAAAYGRHEVVLETNPVNIAFGQLTPEQVVAVMNVWCQRISALGHSKKISYVSVFHNSGLEAGASVEQTHSQIVAIAAVPPQLRYEAEVFAKTKRQLGTSPLAKAMNFEEEQKIRLIYADKYLVVVAPYASQWPYEAWLVPRRQVKSLCQLKALEVDSLARALKAIVLALETEKISYNFHLVEDLKGYDNHFYIKVTPRPNVWAGFELNTGIPINPVAPEAAAEWYRNFIEANNAL